MSGVAPRFAQHASRRSEDHSRDPAADALADSVIALAEGIVHVLGGQVHRGQRETQIQACVERVLRSSGYAVQRECHLSERDRPDFFDTVREHGTPRGYAGFHCLPCVEATRAYQRTSAAQRRNGYRANWIDASAVRDHIRALLAVEAGTDRSNAVITVGAIAAAAGVPIGLIKKLNSDAPDPRCHPLHHRAILATTEHDVRAVRTIPRTRGRRGIAGHRETVDAAPTWRIVDALTEAGWTAQAWTALGYVRATHLPFTRENVTAAQAKMVALLHESLDGDLTPPSVPPPRRRRSGSAHDISDGADHQWARALLEQGYQPQRVAQRTGLSAATVALLHARLFGRAA